MILDRGFYSALNLDKMAEMSIKFIIPLPRTNKSFFSLLDDNKKQLSDYRNAFLFKEEILFHTQGSIKIENRLFNAHLFFNQQKGNEQTLRFLKKIFELEKSVIQKTFKTKTEVIQYLKNTSQFFQISFKEGILQMIRKPRIISNHITNFGVIVMLTNKSHLNQETILELYRKKD